MLRNNAGYFAGLPEIDRHLLLNIPFGEKEIAGFGVRPCAKMTAQQISAVRADTLRGIARNGSALIQTG